MMVNCFFGDKKVIITMQDEPKLYLYAITKEKVRMKFLPVRSCNDENMVYLKDLGDSLGIMFHNHNFLYAKPSDPSVILKDLDEEMLKEENVEQFKWLTKKYKFGYKIINGGKCLEVRGEAEPKTKYLNLKSCADIPEQVFDIEICYDVSRGKLSDKLIGYFVKNKIDDKSVKSGSTKKYFSYSYHDTKPSILAK